MLLLLVPNILVLWLCLVGTATSLVWNQAYPSKTVPDKYLAPFALQLKDFPTTGRGVCTAVDRSPGDVILKVPVDDTITLPKLEQLLPHFEPNKYAEFTQEQLIALGIMQLEKIKHPYISTMLPSLHLSLWTLPTEIWSSHPLKILPRCYREIFQDTRTAALDFSQTVLEKEIDQDGTITMQDCLWAYSMARTRTTTVPDVIVNGYKGGSTDSSTHLALIPGIDLFNDHHTPGTAVKLIGDNWIMFACKPYKAGEQIFTSYLEEKERDSWTLFLKYGFAATGCFTENRVISYWTWEDLVDAVGQIRPNVFPENIRRGLLNHPQLRAFTMRSEDRALFSMESKTKTPRESLEKGLQTLSNFVTQLKFPNDYSLENDVLEQLVKNRVKEIRTCLGFFDKKTTESGGEWRPFLQSLHRLLQHEESCLAI